MLPTFNTTLGKCKGKKNARNDDSDGWANLKNQ
jgi:hypothetical protein